MESRRSYRYHDLVMAAFVTVPVCRAVNFLKRAEREGYFDRDTDFTRFSLRA